MMTTEDMLDAALAHYNRAVRRTRHASGTRYYERALAWDDRVRPRIARERCQPRPPHPHPSRSRSAVTCATWWRPCQP